MNKTIEITYDFFHNISELSPKDAALLLEARTHTYLSYAPYSKFHVAAVALLDNGQLVYGANQENASYPAGICAERTLLSSISSQFPKQKAIAIAISYQNELGNNIHPISPCGICRQTLVEYEQRWQMPIKLILSGQEGNIIILKSAKDIMPLGFTSDDMK